MRRGGRDRSKVSREGTAGGVALPESPHPTGRTHELVLVYNRLEHNALAPDAAWEPGIVVPRDEVRPGMLPEDEAEDFDGQRQIVVRLFNQHAFVAPELNAVRVLDPNKRPYIACVAADEGFLHRTGARESI